MIEKKNWGPITQFTMGRSFEGKPVYIMACYYVDGLLIDTGPFTVAEEIEEAFRNFPVKQIVNTHHHEDHIGNNIIFQEKYGTGPALAHKNAVKRIINPDSWTQRLRAYQHFAWGSPPPSLATEIGEKVCTSRYEFNVLYTPGHSDDHICLLEPEQGWLFSGDIFIKDEVKMLRSDEDFHQIMNSLHELLRYNFNTLFCSSGRIVENAHRAIQHKLDYWDKLRTSIQSLHKQGFSADAIREEILGAESVLFNPTEGDFAKINLVSSILEK